MENSKKRVFITVSLAAALLAVIVWRFLSIDAPIRALDGKTTQLEVVAAGYARPTAYGWQVDIRLESVAGVLYCMENLELKPGDLLSGDLRVTRQYRSGCFFKAEPRGDLTVTVRDTPLRFLPAVWSQGLQDRVAALFSGDGAQLLTGILTGNRSGFSTRLNEGLFSAGMTHVAAVSGLHISMLVGFIALVVGNRRRALFVSLPLIFVYAAITGFSPSAVRAAVMCSLYLAAPLLGREYNSWRGMAAALPVLLVVNPYALFDPGLQLSFSATMGLVLFSGKWQSALLRRMKGKTPLHRYGASALASSCAALVFSAPIAAYWFGGVSILSPITNFLLIWLVTLIFIGGALAVLLSFLWFPAGLALSAVVSRFLKLFMAGLDLAARVPFAVVYTSQPLLIAWLAYLYGLFLVFALTRKWKVPAALAVCSLVLCVGLTLRRDGRGQLEIAVLDVGQGQCVVLRSGGQTVVIDCGGAGQAGRVAARYLQSKGVRRVDRLLLTHYDADHVSGVPALAEAVPIVEIWGPDLPGVPSDLTVDTLTDDMNFMLGAAAVTLIPTRWIGDGNEACMAVVVTLDGFSFIMTGDLGASSERWLLRAEELPRGGVLMAGHHGSAHSCSDEWLDTLAPWAVIISSGPNTYGHPAPATLARLFARDIALYRTDRSGSVVITVNSAFS